MDSSMWVEEKDPAYKAVFVTSLNISLLDAFITLQDS